MCLLNRNQPASSIALIVALLIPSAVSAEQLFQLRNGMTLRGTMTEVVSIKEDFAAVAANQAGVRPIWMIDDGLRRTYIHGKGMVAGKPVDIANLEETIEFWQPRVLGGRNVGGLGSVLGVSEFNEYGRRRLQVRGPEGRPLDIVQGITELNSRYARLKALPVKGNTPLIWDMRLATTSLSSPTLNRIFSRRIERTDLDGMLRVVNFYIQTERFADAKEALRETIKQFPNEDGLKQQLTALTERQAVQLLQEAETRSEAGQRELARGILEGFPIAEVGQLARFQVQDALQELDRTEQQSRDLVAQLRQQVGQLQGVDAQSLQPIVDEIAAGLSADTLARLSDYARLGNVNQLPLDSRVSLAIAGWLLGSGSGEQNLRITISLIQVRDLVAEYLGTDNPGRHRQILDTIVNLEGAAPEYVDRILANLTPPLPLPPEAESEAVAGMFELQGEHHHYLVQLPPEYNPLRSYPCILALHTAGSSPHQQLDFWAGPYSEQTATRRGHATRHGFIVVAPIWGRPGQQQYEYTAAEHHRVLTALRDAMRRTSIDADRIFVVGHGEGATAAWDIALAHPDLWAGMISINGAPSKNRIVPHYKANSIYVPLYLVMGDRDGKKPNGSLMNDYLSFKNDAMVVKYRGRGRGSFYDEIHRMFEWMQLSSHRRKPLPREFEVSTMRAGDQFFWWLELGDLNPEIALDPILWDQAGRKRKGTVYGSIGNGNQIRIRGPTDRFTLLLRPQAGIDLYKPIVIRGSGVHRDEYDRKLDFMLEDARRRADRKRVFWHSVTVP